MLFWPQRLRRLRFYVALAVQACMALLGDVGQPALAMDPYPSCIGNQCFRPDFLGGLGLTPKRQYVALYGRSELCKEALQEINAAIRAGKQSMKAVQRPLPDAARSGLPEWYGEPVTDYETRNPIFAGAMFLPWNFINANPGPYPPGIEPDEQEQKDDEERARWLIAPVFNDGVPILMTQNPTAGITVWDVPTDQLDKHDWSDWRTYRAFKPRLAACQLDANQSMRGPLAGFSSWCPDRQGNYGSGYGKLYGNIRNPKYSLPDRAISIANFAIFSGRYYIVLQAPNQDMISITDDGDGFPAPEDYGRSRVAADQCYLAPRWKRYPSSLAHYR